MVVSMDLLKEGLTSQIYYSSMKQFDWLDEGSAVDVVYLDFQNVFNKLAHIKGVG